MAKTAEKKKITAAIVAHVDAGKTTLAERMLLECGVIRRQGRVDRGDTLLDNDPVERERGITIFSSGAAIETDASRITLLDTPGHVDFSSEAERTLSASDVAVVVISATDGVQSHTVTVWRLLEEYRIPAMIFVTKCDLGRHERGAIMAQLARRFGNCVDMERSGENYTNVEKIAETSEELLDEYLATGNVTDGALRRAVSERSLFPVLFGSGLTGEGVPEFISMLASLSPEPSYTDDFSAVVYKIARDRGERVTHLKITGGDLRVKDAIFTGAADEKVDQIRFYTGAKYTVAESASRGDVCAVTGLSATFCGQGLGSSGRRAAPRLEPVMRYRVTLPADVAPQTFLPKLMLLCEEEPGLAVEWDEGASCIRASLMGLVQAEVLKRMISDRFGVDVSFDSGDVIYKETVTRRVEGVGHYEPLRHYAEVHVVIEPAPRGSGVTLGADCPESVLEGRWQRLIMTHLAEREHLGVLTGSPLTDVKITLVSGRAHIKHTEGGDFRQATYRAVRQGLMRAESILLEPYYLFEIELPVEHVGRAISDVRMMGGEFKAPVENDGTAVLSGASPVRTMDQYMATLASYTGGRGRLSLSPGGFRECHDAKRVTEEASYDPEADLANSPDSVFCAHGAGFVVKWCDVEKYMHVDGIREAGGEAPRRRHVSIDEEELERIMLREFGPIKRPEYSEPRRVEAKELHRVAGVGTSLLVIDGYNVIHAWDDLASLAQAGDLDGARGRLLNIIANYSSFTGCRTVVVFDAYMVPGGHGERTTYHGVEVVYTKENETADAYIERLVAGIGKNDRVRVVTSDWLIQLTAVRTGVLRLSSAEFEAEVSSVEEKISDIIEKNSEKYSDCK